MKKLILILIFVIVKCNQAFAFDVGYMTFNESLQNSKFAFVGFVKEIKVTGKDKGIIHATASVDVELCLISEYCVEGKTLEISYLPKVALGTSLPVEILIGSEVVVALKDEPRGSSYQFDSDINDGIDYLFSCDNFPYSILGETEEKVICVDSVFRKKYEITYSLLGRVLISNMALLIAKMPLDKAGNAANTAVLPSFVTQNKNIFASIPLRTDGGQEDFLRLRR